MTVRGNAEARLRHRSSQFVFINPEIPEKLFQSTDLEVVIAMNGNRKDDPVSGLGINVMTFANPLKFPSVLFQNFAKSFSRNGSYNSTSTT
jgi:hypothetical protein